MFCYARAVFIVNLDRLPSKEIPNQKFIPEVPKDFDMGIEILAVRRRSDKAAATVSTVRDR